MQQLLLVLVGIIIASGIGYFVGFDHGFKKAPAAVSNAYERAALSDAATTMGNIIGLWRSNDDPQFTREIRNDGTIIDRYEGVEDSEGVWMVFTKEIPDTAYDGPIEDGAVYLSLAFSESERLHFKIVTADGGSLDLIYLDRGGALSFHRVQ